MILLVDSGFACGGVIALNGKIVETAPIFRKWFLGKPLAEAKALITRKGWRVLA